MKNDPLSDGNKTTRPEVTPLFGSAKILLDETPKAITPFGGMASLVAFLQQIGFAREVEQALPFPVSASPNAIPLAHTFTAFVIAVIAGASRFAHTDWLRADRALHALLGIARFPGTDTVRNFFLRFTQAHVARFWPPLWRWLLSMVSCPPEGFHLDLDSTVFQRSGSQEGAVRGYNPRRPGRKSHHPLLAVLAQRQVFLHGWLRPGDSAAAGGAVSFLQEALALLPAGLRIGCVRADSGFFEEALLSLLEQKHLSYLIVARLTTRLQRRCAAIKDWTDIDENYAAGAFHFRLLGWSQERRFIVIRERVLEEKEAVGHKLLEVPGYTFRVWVTDRSGSAIELWREYNGRATVEQRIQELKSDLAAGGFCLHEFFATEAAFLATLFTFNLLSLYQQMTTPEQSYRQPATLRTQVFLAGGILGRAGKELVMKLSQAWGGLAKHKPLLEAVLQWPKLTSPKLVHPPDRLAIGGGYI